MTIPEASRLVLLAGSFSTGGDVFVLDMGKPVKIMDLARRMIQAHGLEVKDAENPEGDIAIEVTGALNGRIDEAVEDEDKAAAREVLLDHVDGYRIEVPKAAE